MSLAPCFAMCNSVEMLTAEQFSNGDVIGTLDAAKILGVDQATVWRWAQNGKLDAIDLGAGRKLRFLFMREDIERLRDGRLAEAS